MRMSSCLDPRTLPIVRIPNFMSSLSIHKISSPKTEWGAGVYLNSQGHLGTVGVKGLLAYAPS